MFFHKKENSTPARPYFVICDTPNRPLCIEKMSEAIQTSPKAKGAFVKMYIENFKTFNNAFGYEYGGMLLNEVAHYLSEELCADVYRYGGVEFIAVMEEASFVQATEGVEKVLERFERAWRINDLDCMCSVDMGIVFYPDHSPDAETAASHLEQAVSESAERGQNQYTVYNQELIQKLQRRQTIANDLKDALKSGKGIEFRYRPTYCVAKKMFTRAEGYLWLISPTLGRISAQEFLPIAEQLGLVCAVNQLELRHTCGLIRELLDEKKDFESIAVCISPILFLQESFPEDVRALLAEYGIPAEKLAFELSESILIDSFSQVNIVMQELSELGVEFILNEFGTGYSGITNILDLPVDVLKLERLFIWQLEDNERSGILIEGLISIAGKLGLKIIAEGVETENQLQKLAAYGCPYEQGFYYSPTVEAEGLKELLQSL